MELIQIILFCTVVVPLLGTDEGKVMNSFSEHVGNVVLQCDYEEGMGKWMKWTAEVAERNSIIRSTNRMHFKKEVIAQFRSFWNPKHDLRGMNLGCAIACVLKTLQLMERGGQLRKQNAVAFLKANGADPTMSAKMMELFNLCSHAVVTKRPKNGCILGLEIAKCFRYGIFKLQWAPEFRQGPETFKTTKKAN